jgi:tRNA(His) 5'-end guanylyltransferase
LLTFIFFPTHHVFFKMILKYKLDPILKEFKRYRRFGKEIKTLYELNQILMPETFIILRLDGKNFKNLTKYYQFLKPNDQTHVNLMNKCALEVFSQYHSDLMLAYGYSDEFSFAFYKETNLFNRNFR